MAVYLLQHLIEREDGDDVKVIGIYSSAALANAAALELSLMPGFRDSPQGFTIDAYELNTTFWKEGFGVEAEL